MIPGPSCFFRDLFFGTSGGCPFVPILAPWDTLGGFSTVTNHKRTWRSRGTALVPCARGYKVSCRAASLPSSNKRSRGRRLKAWCKPHRAGDRLQRTHDHLALKQMFHSVSAHATSEAASKLVILEFARRKHSHRGHAQHSDAWRPEFVPLPYYTAKALTVTDHKRNSRSRGSSLNHRFLHLPGDS